MPDLCRCGAKKDVYMKRGQKGAPPDHDKYIALMKAALPNVLAGDRKEAKPYGACTVGE